jgi:hypothetical protein
LTLIRGFDAHHEITLEVEVFVPETDQMLALGSSMEQPDDAENGGMRLRPILERHIRHLQCLLKLEKRGFALSVIPEEGIWSARCTLESPPDARLLESILPLTG